MSQDEIQTHCQTHSQKTVSNIIIDVKLLENVEGISKLLHFCEICSFATPRYLDIVKHLNTHSSDEANDVDRVKYTKKMSSENEMHMINSPLNNNLCYGFGKIKGSKRKIYNSGIYIPL